MYRVLIVDDERYVRLWVKNCIRWEDYGFEIAGEAENGSMALCKIQELKPRLVITDMDMPGVNGVKLIERVNESYPDIMLLVLSGYDTYEYMSSAVKNNAIDYLLKPIDEEELTPVIEKIRRKLEYEDKKREDEVRTKIVFNENLEHKREKFLKNLIDGNILTENEVQRRMKELGIHSDGGSFSVLVIRFDEEAGMNEPSNFMDDELIKFSIINIAKEVLSSNSIRCYFLSIEKAVVSIINFNNPADNANQSIMGIYRRIIESINTFLNVSVSIGVGNAVKDVMDIEASYQEAIKALDLELIYGNNNVLTFLSMQDNSIREIFGAVEESSISTAIAALDFDSCKSIITSIFEKLRKSDNLNIETIKMVYYRLVSSILNEIYKAGISPSLLNIEELDMFIAIKKLNSIDKIRDNLVSLISKTIEGISNIQKIKNSAVEKAKSYIRKNYKNDINLTDISKVVCMTPNYFSTLFKAETGCNVSEYITRLRIEKVISLMSDKNLKTYEIGEIVGYKEPKYFCRVFKKITGQSPMQYRKQLLDKR